MYWPPNIDGIHWFLNEILPWIRQKRPNSVVDLVGARPPQSLIECGQKDSKINVTGYVPELLPYMEQAGVFVVPLRAGGGMRVKILEALARGLPLVTTTLGCEGIAVEDGRHVLIADTPEGFAAAVIRLLDDRSLADQLGHNGRELIENTYDYRAACKPLDEVYHPSAARSQKEN
jgi:polysaccharide biosynthesis protein PslH